MSEAKLNVKLLRFTPDPESLIAIAGKLCYSAAKMEDLVAKQTPEDIERFVGMLADIGHESPLEHVSFSFGVEGVSRVLTHQLVRHRIASYSQQSQRYVKLAQFEYIVPKEIKNNSWAYKRFAQAMKEDQKHYDVIVDQLMTKYAYQYLVNNITDFLANEDEVRMIRTTGICKDIINKFKGVNKKEFKAAEKKAIENARYVFPNACETKIILTMNGRSLLHFFSERCCNRAQDEIRTLARAMNKECKAVAPNLFKNSGPKCYKLDMCPEDHMSCGLFKTKEEIFEGYYSYKDLCR